jgi:hypothetical protein
LGAEERRIANYIGFIGEGKGTRSLGEALKVAEQKVLTLRAELQAYEASGKAVFRAPPVEWIADRLMALRPMLEAETSRSALELRRCWGGFGSSRCSHRSGSPITKPRPPSGTST